MAPKLDLGYLLVHLGLEGKQFLQDIAAAERKMQAAGRKLQAVGNQLSLKVTAPLVAVGAAATKVASDLESSFTGIRKTVNATEKEFDSLKKQFDLMSLTTPMLLTNLHGIGEAAGQLGIETKNIASFSKVMADLGATTNINAKEAAMQLARLSNITGMSQTDFDRMGSSIVDLGNNMATTEADIVNMSLGIAGAARVAKISESDILAMSAAVSSIGIQAELGSTAISRIILDINNFVKMSAPELETLSSVAGMTGEGFRQAFEKDAAGAIQKFINGLGELQKTGVNINSIIEELGWQNIRTTKTILGLASAQGLLKNAMDISSAAWAANTALSKEAELRYKTFSSRLAIAKNILILVGEDIGKIIIPAFTKFVESLTSLIAHWFLLSEEMKKNIVIWGGIAAAIGPALLIFAGLLKTLSLLKLMIFGIAGALTKASIAALKLTLSLAPVFAILTSALAGIELGRYFYDEFAIVQRTAAEAVLFIWEGWEKLKESLKLVFAAIGYAWDVVVGSIKKGFAMLSHEIANGLRKMAAIGGELGEKFKNAAWEVENFSRNLKAAAKPVPLEVRYKGVEEEYQKQMDFIDDVRTQWNKEIDEEFNGKDRKGKGFFDWAKEESLAVKGVSALKNKMMELLDIKEKISGDEEDGQGFSLFGKSTEDIKGIIQKRLDEINAAIEASKKRIGPQTEEEYLKEMYPFMSSEFLTGDFAGTVPEISNFGPQLPDMTNKIEENATVAENAINRVKEAYKNLSFTVQESYSPIADWGKRVSRVGENIEAAFVNAFDSMGDELANFVLEGKANFADLAKQLIKDILAITIKALILLPILSAIGLPVGGANVIPASTGSGASITQMANGGIFPGSFKAFANGGVATGPTLGLVAENGQNEAVVPLPNGRSIPVDMKNAQTAPTIIINNNSGQQIEQDGIASYDGEKWVVNLVTKNILQNGSMRQAILGVNRGVM